MKVKCENQLINLDTKNLLGTGGEADVIKHGNFAFKIYHTPTTKHQAKLKAFIASRFKLPSNLAYPISLVFTEYDKFIGFTMRVAKSNTEFMKLSNKVFRNKSSVSLPQVLKLFAHTKTTLDTIHAECLVVGDLNDLNLLYTKDFKSIFIDVDSFQFSKYPCPVGTDQFIDPTLLNIDLTKSPNFTKESDWYAFTVLLFKSLLYVHPFGGKHPTIRNMFERMTKGISVMDKSVVYPKIGLNPDILSDDLLSYFDTTFTHGKRIDISPNIFEKLSTEFIHCTNCNTWFHIDRNGCPNCSKTTVTPSIKYHTTKTIDGQVCDCEILFTTTGIITFTKVINGKVLVFSKKTSDEANLVLTDGISTSRIIVNETSTGYTAYDSYNYFGIRYVANIGEALYVEGKLITETMSFDNEPQWGCSDRYLYRLTPTMLMRGEFDRGHYIERPITATLESQTKIWVGYNDVVLGYMRVLNGHQYFLTVGTNTKHITIPITQGRVIEQTVEFTGDRILLLKRTLLNGRTYSHLYLIDHQGNIIKTCSEPSLNSPYLKSIFGKQLVGSTIVHPTDDGIVMERLDTEVLKSATEPYVNSGSTLLVYKQGILVVDSSKIQYLTLK